MSVYLSVTIYINIYIYIYIYTHTQTRSLSLSIHRFLVFRAYRVYGLGPFREFTLALKPTRFGFL